jgi:hypothetical protein
MIKEDIIQGYEGLMLLEIKEKVERDYTSQSLDHSVILISPEIKEQIESNKVFENVIETFLSEITNTLNEEWHGQIGYIVEISIIQDYEYPSWRDNVIRIKVPIKDPKYVIQLRNKVSCNVWRKVELIEEDAEEIKRISDNTRISFRILE